MLYFTFCFHHPTHHQTKTLPYLRFPPNTTWLCEICHSKKKRNSVQGKNNSWKMVPDVHVHIMALRKTKKKRKAGYDLWYVFKAPLTERILLSTGVIPLPLSVVLRVETNQSESAPAHSRRQGCPLYPAFLALHQAAEKDSRWDHSMRSMVFFFSEWGGGHDKALFF